MPSLPYTLWRTTLQTTAQVLYYTRSPKHIEALWFANVGNQVLWWTYVKACWRAVGSILSKKGITFKTTMKVR